MPHRCKREKGGKGGGWKRLTFDARCKGGPYYTPLNSGERDGTLRVFGGTGDKKERMNHYLDWRSDLLIVELGGGLHYETFLENFCRIGREIFSGQQKGGKEGRKGMRRHHPIKREV